jgi:hypothetical protein
MKAGGNAINIVRGNNNSALGMIAKGESPARPAMDDNTLNARIKQLRSQRDNISKIAIKYSLEDDRKVS